MGKKVLFIYKNYSSFVKTDYEILSSKYEVVRYQYKPVKGIFNNIIEFAKQFLYLLLNIWKHDAVFIWFADYHSLLPVILFRILNKKSFVVIGGYDICRIKSLDYGVFNSRLRGFFAHQTIKKSSLNITVSNYVDRKVKWIAPDSNRLLVYNSVRLKDESQEIQKKDYILSVGQIDNEQTFLRKGIDTFIEVAKLLPNYSFILVGIDSAKFNHFLNSMPPNVQLFKKVPQQELTRYYSQAKIYAQFSRMDTFCLTLAEAMLFESFPIITNEGGMPEVVGDRGLILKRDTELIAEKIDFNIQNFSKINTGLIKNRIINKFSISRRSNSILKLMESMI